jgi:gentisate 1,2-dioxygenase
MRRRLWTHAPIEEIIVSVQTAPSSSTRFYDRLDRQHLAPLWESLHQLVTREPTTPVQAFKWDYDSVLRPLVMEAGNLLTAQQAERRVLILENPGLRGLASITRTLYAGVQLILPGEVAPSHRHTQSALRLVMEGSGAYTAVDGERTQMHRGDFITTPSWTWHDHGNDTPGPMVWLDVLDIPMIRALDASFAEPGRAQSQAVTRPVGDSHARYANNLFPVDWSPQSRNSPIFNYPYTRSRESLDFLARNGAPDPHHAYKLRYVNPATGGPPLPTIGTYIQFVPRAFETLPYRATDATIHTCIEGEGETQVGDITISWKARDVFVTPGWSWIRHRASAEAVLFSASDRPVQEMLGLWREERAGG